MRKHKIKQFQPRRYKEKRYSFNNPIYIHLNLIRRAILWYLNETKTVNHSEMGVLFNISRERIRQLLNKANRNPELKQLYRDILEKYFSPEKINSVLEKYK